jgi:drug/metabolite transporter (DMT)-like permease
MSKTKKQTKHRWNIVALLAACLAAPNGTFIKIAFEDLDVLTFNSLRFGLIALVTLPYLLMMLRKFTKKNFKYSIYMGISLTIAVLCYSTNVQLSQASYASIIQLGLPIVFIIYSILMTKEKVKLRSVLGIAIAAVGAFLVVALPIIMSGGDMTKVNPFATAVGIIDCLVYPLSVIFSRKANEAGLPVMVSFCMSAIIVAIVCTALAFIFNGPTGYLPAMSPDVIIAVGYSGIIVALIVRMLNVLSYERIGSAALSGASYLESLLAILIPLIALGERLSIELVVGAILIVIGVYIVETVHNTRQHRHIRVMQHR